MGPFLYLFPHLACTLVFSTVPLVAAPSASKTSTAPSPLARSNPAASRLCGLSGDQARPQQGRRERGLSSLAADEEADDAKDLRATRPLANPTANWMSTRREEVFFSKQTAFVHPTNIGITRATPTMSTPLAVISDRVKIWLH